jgi:hypothetical protein
VPPQGRFASRARTNASGPLLPLIMPPIRGLLKDAKVAADVGLMRIQVRQPSPKGVSRDTSSRIAKRDITPGWANFS